MRIEPNATLMRIYLSESARHGRHGMLPTLVEALAAAGIAGATAFKGIEGYGKSRTISSARVVDGWVDLPLLIEVVDDDAKIRGFLPALDALLDDGLVTLERLQTVFYRFGSGSAR